ncbi:sensor histidine kinase [uncultured Clostridium sp.]|uniref:sensor histidine kinase n=1 Tax=uncultured Clostridium sp. TaxID=59620 RepID=UPI00267108F2|nr:sensor histidine kinase [uncultured Clostridium sp.]
MILIVGEEIGILSAVIWYYSILFIYAIYIKAKVNLSNVFWITQSVSNCLCVFILTYIFGAFFEKCTFLEFYNDNSLLKQIIFFFSVLFRIKIIKVNIKNRFIIDNLSNNQKVIAILVFLIIQFFLIITLKGSVVTNNPVTFYDGILVILLFGVDIFFYKILTFLSKEIEEKYLLEMSIKKSELEERYIEEISQIYTDIKSWKHDYRNNINVICNLAVENKHEELFKYIEEFDKEIMVAEAVIYSGVFIIDSVVTSKYLYGSSKGIKFKINTDKIEKGNISDFDINIIISNILDNAIEGALRAKEKKVDINIYEKDNNIVFKIRNTFDGYIEKCNGSYLTIKEKNLHGLGINRVKKVISKYNGMLYMSDDNNIFESKVIIPIK